MRRFSANLGFLWTDRPLPQAIRAAKAAGFAAVECHFPYAVPPAEVARALTECSAPVILAEFDRETCSRRILSQRPSKLRLR